LTPERLFADLLAERPAQPFVTYYDEASGERSELSAKSLANWVAKTHHLLVDEVGLDVGARAYLAVPAHWISVPVLLGCLTAGLNLLDDPSDASPDGSLDGSSDGPLDGSSDGLLVDIAFVGPQTAASAVAAGVLDVYAVNPVAAATGFAADPPTGTLDYVTAVRPQADVWAGVHLRGSDGDPCLAGRSRGEVVELARARAAEFGLSTGSRALTTRDWHGHNDWVDTVLAPLAVGGSIVIVGNCTDEDVVTRRMAQERADIRI
jgi:uncharacterized protein (TIGR03089 family)